MLECIGEVDIEFLSLIVFVLNTHHHFLLSIKSIKGRVSLSLKGERV